MKSVSTSTTVIKVIIRNNEDDDKIIQYLKAFTHRLTNP